MIRTKRLVLRPFAETDFEALRTLIADKMASPWAPYDAQWSLEEARLRASFNWLRTQPGWYAMDKDGDIIGFIVAQPTDEGKAREIGYTVRSDMQRKGFAHEACAAIMRELAKDEALEKFTAGTAEFNHPSIALLTKLGFEPKLRHRAWFKKDDSGNPMWFIGYSFECPAAKYRDRI